MKVQGQVSGNSAELVLEPGKKRLHRRRGQGVQRAFNHWKRV